MSHLLTFPPLLHLSIGVFFFFFLLGDGKCVICDSFVNLTEIVHICDECNYGSFEGRCVVCGNPGVTDAHYCRECVQQEKDRDGCPKVRVGQGGEKRKKNRLLLLVVVCRVAHLLTCLRCH